MAKRIFDIVASVSCLVLVSPVLLAISIIIKLRMPGPVFFCQTRVGRHGKQFTIFKFRTMVVNNSGNTVTIKGEDRITPLGAKLRNYKLDELPELWNVLIGDMSFVGPRPDVPEYANKLVGEEKRILDLRPGLTSPASIKYFNEEETVAFAHDPQKYYNEVIWPDKIRINLDYCQNRSFFGDISLIFRTALGRRTFLRNSN